MNIYNTTVYPHLPHLPHLQPNISTKILQEPFSAAILFDVLPGGCWPTSALTLDEDVQPSNVFEAMSQDLHLHEHEFSFLCFQYQLPLTSHPRPCAPSFLISILIPIAIRNPRYSPALQRLQPLDPRPRSKIGQWIFERLEVICDHSSAAIANGHVFMSLASSSKSSIHQRGVSSSGSATGSE